MKIPPPYSITPDILEIISKIDANRYFLASQKIPVNRKDKIQHLGLLKSSLFSARIEGNRLTPADLETTAKSEEKKKYSIFWMQFIS